MQKVSDPCQPAQSTEADLSRKLLLLITFLQLNTFCQTTNFRLIQTEDNFKVDENGRYFSKQVENTVGNGEIARNEQFHLFPQCFQGTCTTDTYTRAFTR